MTPLMLDALVGVARLDGRCGELEQAVELAEFVLSHPTALHETRVRARQLLLELKPRLEPEQGGDAETRLSGRSLDSVLDALLSGASR
jgi:hypothetical protein